MLGSDIDSGNDIADHKDTKLLSTCEVPTQVTEQI